MKMMTMKEKKPVKSDGSHDEANYNYAGNKGTSTYLIDILSKASREQAQNLIRGETEREAKVEGSQKTWQTTAARSSN
ncbi:uncharacterized protein ATNIH1004_004590 [Aspergillus tanneri]|uniref:Uncharacterized protein n=1 Tax=Aspergillus tanneri TaxID=1220188 RepID=A0A5M9MNV8_9EURO|nr:uncharacterized protein ATNIH1004_004590 [Aspergillus tanneri]KAA8648705.1 hypothetical protein ATNIH1004_004590 [Aspergillus tanneri]